MNPLRNPRNRILAAQVARQIARRAAKASPLGDLAPEAIDLLLGNPDAEWRRMVERRLAALEKGARSGASPR